MKKLRKVFVGIVLTILFLPVMVNASQQDYDFTNVSASIISETVELEVDAQYDVSNNIRLSEELDPSVQLEYEVVVPSNNIFAANGNKIMALEQGLGNVYVEVYAKVADKREILNGLRFNVLVKPKKQANYAHVNIKNVNRMIYELDSFQIDYEIVKPEGSTASNEVSWAIVKGEELATVTDTGFVLISKGSGEVVVSATSSTGEVSTMSFHVYKKVSLEFGLYAEEIHSKSVEVGQRYDVSSLLWEYSYTGDEYKLVWSSSDDSIVSVDQKGVITTNKIGKANITVAAVVSETGKVLSNASIEIISTGYKSTVIIAKDGIEDLLGFEYIQASSTLQLIARVISNNPDKSVTWEIVEPLEGVTISSTGLLTVAEGVEGRTTIKATNADGVSTYLRVYINPLATVKNDAFYYYNVKVGTVKDFKALLIDYSDRGYRYEFSSNDETIATVDRNGLVTTLQSGLVAIKYKLYAEDGTLIVEGVFKLNVGTEFSNDSIAIAPLLDTDNYEGLLLNIGGKIKLNILTNSDSVTYNFVNETPEIVTIEEDGTITGVSKGIANIYVDVYNDGISMSNYNSSTNNLIQIYVGYGNTFMDYKTPSEVNLQLGDKFKLNIENYIDNESTINYYSYIGNSDILSFADEGIENFETKAIGSTFIETMTTKTLNFPWFKNVKSTFVTSIPYFGSLCYVTKVNVYEKISNIIDEIVNPTPGTTETGTGNVIGTNSKEYFGYNEVIVDSLNTKNNTETSNTTNQLESSDNKKKDKNDKKEVKLDDDDEDDEKESSSKAPIIILIIVVAGGLIFGVYKAKDMLE